MDTTQDLDQNAELKKVHQLLAKNIDDFKYLVLSNMRLEEDSKLAEEDSKPAKETLHLELNRISDFQNKTTESLEEWVSREFAPKPDKKEAPSYIDERPGETIEEWVARQRINPITVKYPKTIIDIIEQWLMNEAKKDLFKEVDAIFVNPEGLSSDYIRELGFNLISLANKLEKIKK